MEGYRTAQMSGADKSDRVVQLPVAGETLVIPARAIMDFLDASGLGGLARRFAGDKVPTGGSVWTFALMPD